MDIKICRKCRRMFNYVMGEVICPACKQKIEEEFQKVKTYVRQHPNASVAQVSEECEVTVEQIRQWLREERLCLTGESPQLTCDGCGAMIMSGKLCDKCKNETLNALKNISQSRVNRAEPAKKTSDGKNKMRFLDR